MSVENYHSAVQNLQVVMKKCPRDLGKGYDELVSILYICEYWDAVRAICNTVHIAVDNMLEEFEVFGTEKEIGCLHDAHDALIQVKNKFQENPLNGEVTMR